MSDIRRNCRAGSRAGGGDESAGAPQGVGRIGHSRHRAARPHCSSPASAGAAHRGDPGEPEATLLLTTAFYTSLLTMRWIAPDAAWWVVATQVIAAFAIASVLAWVTAAAAPMIAAGYPIFLAGRAFWAHLDRARGIA